MAANPYQKMKYIFYRLHQLMISVGNGNIAEYMATLLFSFLLYLNFVAIWLLVNLLADVKIHFPIPALLLMYFLLILTLYLLFLKNDKYKMILLEYRSESKNKALRGKYFVIFYIILSQLILFALFYLMILKNRGM